MFERVETYKKGKPIQPKEPENTTAYYLRYTEGGKRTTKPTGQNFTEAVTAWRMDCGLIGVPKSVTTVIMLVRSLGMASGAQRALC